MFNPLPQTGSEFYRSILSNSITALKNNHFRDNFDARRFNSDGQDHSQELNPESRAFYFDWFFRHHSRLFGAYEALCDEYSRKLFLHLVAYRLGGHLSIRIPVGFIERRTEYLRYKAREKYVPSDFGTQGMFGSLRHYDFEYDGKRYIGECVSLEPYLFRQQYFYAKDGVRIAAENGDHVIDGGAFTGDATLVFSNAVGPDGVVYAFDPVADHIDVLRLNIGQFPIRNVKIMPYGLSDRKVDTDPVLLNRYCADFNVRHANVPLRSVDELVAGNEIQRIDFLKLDVEGSELDSLRGAARSIAGLRPKLAVSIYHRPEDLFEIIEFIVGTFPFYKLYLDHYTIHMEETVLYCEASSD